MSDETTNTQEEKEVVETPAEAPAQESTEAPEAPAAEEATEETKEEAPAEEASEEATEEVAEEAPVETPDPAQAWKTKLVNTDDLRPGMTVRLHEKIKDVSPKGDVRERIQVFEGLVMQMGGSGISRTVTLRKVSKGFGVEKIYPINSPVVDKIELVKTARVRRAKLGFLRNIKRRFKRKLKETHIKK